ncbi:Mitogen-activated protein kinase 4a [Phlyctochytrium planicorne]|nr:Mitogen-activated protein kinase 4a [Phlyctochytrium planicorne]
MILKNIFLLATLLLGGHICNASFVDGFSLPQNDPSPVRSLATSIIGDLVIHQNTFPGLPPFINGLNGLGVIEFETLMISSRVIPYLLDISRRAIAAQVQFQAANFKITKLSDYLTLYGNIFPSPSYVAANTDFLSDAFFGRSRVLFYGSYIKGYKSIRYNMMPFKLADDDVAGLLPAGETLNSALKAGKLYIEDHTDIAYLAKDLAGGKILAFPIALFYKPTQGSLIPLAIKLDPSSSVVVTPKDGAAWTFGKIAVNSINSQRAALGTHFLDHFALAPITTAFYRTMSTTHPVRVIMSHITRGNIGVISFGSRTLLTPKYGFLDNLFAIGRNGTLDVLASIYKNTYSFFGTVPEEEIYQRELIGLMKDNPFYTTAKQYHATFTTLMNDLINIYYVDDDAVRKDTELQAFAADVGLVAKLKGFPSQFDNREDVAATLAQAMYVATFHHGVVGTTGFDWTETLPLSTLSFWKPLPTKKTDVTDANIVSWLPDVSHAINEIQLVSRFRQTVTAPDNLYHAFEAITSFGFQAVKSDKTICAFDKYKASLDQIAQNVAVIASSDPIIKGWDVMTPSRIPNFVFN